MDTSHRRCHKNRQSYRSTPGRPTEGLSVTNQSGKLTTIPTRDIVALTSRSRGGMPGDRTPDPPASRVHLETCPSQWRHSLRPGRWLLRPILSLRYAGTRSTGYSAEIRGHRSASGAADAPFSLHIGQATDKDIVYLAQRRPPLTASSRTSTIRRCNWPPKAR